MQQTTNLDLELYEATDNANLLDGYNSSMRKLDARDGEVSTLISALNTTLQGHDTRITAAQSTANNAAAAAATADGKADAASATATTADGKADTAVGTANSTAAALAQFMTQPYIDEFTSLSGTTGNNNSWSAECHTFQFGTGNHPLQIVELRGRTLGVSFSSGPAGLYYGTGNHIIPNIVFPHPFLRTPSTLENSSGETWIIKEGEATETSTASANVVKSVQPSSVITIYWSVLAVGLASAPISN